VIPESVNAIGEQAFWFCRNLTYLVIPRGIKQIGVEVFYQCYRLELGVYYHHEPSAHLSIRGYRNKYIYLLNEKQQKIGKIYYLDEGYWGLLKQHTQAEIEEEFASRLMSGLVDHLSEYDALFSSSNEIVIRKARSAICRLEYPLELLDKYKKEYTNYLSKNSELIIPFMIKKGDIAFIGTMVNLGAIPSENISDYVDLANELSQTEILSALLDYKNKNRGKKSPTKLELNITNPASDWATQENEDGSLTITKYLGKNQDVTIPSSLNGKKVKCIEGNLGSLKVSIFFQDRNHINSVIIDEGIEVIGERAFLECKNLISVLIPQSVTMICKEAFFGCNSLTSVVIPDSLDVINPGLFKDCYSLSIIQIPSGVTVIGRDAFSCCSSLQSAMIPDGVKKIGRKAYYGCTSLINVNISESVLEIGYSSFSSCSSLKSVVIPEGVKEIYGYTFGYCTSLSRIRIPESVTKIEYDAFESCNKENLVIYSPRGSYAIDYAKENGIKYLEM
jgi:hypothetical protein